MMAGNTPQHELERLYKLIQQERLDEAASTLRLLIRSDSNNEDVWWLLANAATDPAEAKEALENVTRLNPKRQDAQNLLAQLQESYPDLIPLSPEATTFNPGDIDDPFRRITPTPTVTLDDELDASWLPEAEPAAEVADGAFDDLDEFAAAPADPLDDWLAAPQGSTDGDSDDWMTAAQPVASLADDLDPFDFGEDDKQPAFVDAPKAAVSPKYEAPEFYPESFEGVLPLNPAGRAQQPATAPIATPNPVSADDLPPIDRDEEDEPNRLIPILMGAMLVVVIGIAAFYILTQRTSDVVVLPPTATLNFTVGILPTLDPNATLPTAVAVDATATVLPTLPGSETPEFALPATASVAPPATFEISATPSVDAGVTLTATAVSAATDAVSPATPLVVGATIAPASAPLAESLTKLTDNFKVAGFADATFNIGDTVLGKTLTVKICARPGIELLRATDKARDVIATEAAPYRAELEAVGVQIVSCSDAASALYAKVVPIRVATQYAEKRIDARRYRASWINP